MASAVGAQRRVTIAGECQAPSDGIVHCVGERPLVRKPARNLEPMLKNDCLRKLEAPLGYLGQLRLVVGDIHQQGRLSNLTEAMAASEAEAIALPQYAQRSKDPVGWATHVV